MKSSYLTRGFGILVLLVAVGLVLRVRLFSKIDVKNGFDPRALAVDVQPLLKASCLGCHGAGTRTPLDLSRLGYNLADPATFHSWERVFTRLQNGEMPPKGIPRPDAATTGRALASLKKALIAAEITSRSGQRGPLRRLTRTEYKYTIKDLLALDETPASELEEMLPAEASTRSFDTVAADQRISLEHLRRYLDTADRALDMALLVGPRPARRTLTVDYPNSPQVIFFRTHFGGQGGFMNLTFKGGEVFFLNVQSAYLTDAVNNRILIEYPGRYQVTVEAFPYQVRKPNKPVTLTLHRGLYKQGSAMWTDLIGALDLVGDTPRKLAVTTYLKPGDDVGPAVADLAGPPITESVNILKARDTPRGIYKWPAEGIAMKSMTVEGPLFDEWPPESTRQLLKGVDFDAAGNVVLRKDPYEHVRDIVTAFAQRAFRRNVSKDEAESYAALAKPMLRSGVPFIEAVREPLRAILVAPAFLYQTGPPGDLNNYGIASRLSYFLWRSFPDDELLNSARTGALANPAEVSRQVDRMVDDPKFGRFVTDFAGQAFRLNDLRQTVPDPDVYPEYDDRLGQAMAQETELFLGELFARNLSVRNLIDSDFTFLNRLLAQLYGIRGVTGMEMRKVTLPPGSHRGGLLTQASVLKLTANGTTTSPVRRGNFVLTNLLGQPAPPPPPGVGAIEPDTRGTTTIREQLTAHRASRTCATCHSRIDPPGFALESFDPIGGFRTRYRLSGGEAKFYKALRIPPPYKQGPSVDSSGVTPEGRSFTGIDDYKRLLIKKDLDQVARHFVSALLVFSTGAELGFADRDVVEKILEKTRPEGYPVRTIIHEIAGSDVFRRR
jgi:hypothetical protein